MDGGRGTTGPQHGTWLPAGGRPGRDAVLQVRDGGAVRRLSYGELTARVERLAGWLQRRGAAGRRVLVAVEEGPAAAVAVLGCLRAGAVAVPVPPPSASRAAAQRTAAVVRDAAASLALTESAHAAELSQTLSLAGFGDLECLAVDTGPAESADGAAAPRIGPDSPALLQYTSGSTAAPRGVLVTHGNLLATMTAVRGALGTGPDARIGGCLPLHHDLGLVGQLLHPLWLGATAVVLPVRPVLRDPVRWLEEIARHGVTVSAAPDSLYARCLGALTDERVAALDLSRWRTAVDAAEPVSGATLRAFARRLAPAGLDPRALAAGYGLAEATLMVSVSAPGAAGRAPTDERAAVSCGPAHGAEVRIVDPDSHAVVSEGREGEIWVRGPAVAAGYWNRPLDTAETFGRSTAEGERGFLRTGDLGRLTGGEIRVTGRLKDLMLVDGAPLHPHDLERVLLENGPPFVSAAVFALAASAAADRVVVVQEVRQSGGARWDPDRLVGTVRRGLDEEFGVTPYEVVLVRPGTVRRTTSGKVRRSVMREMYLRGELRPLFTEGRAAA
ncbi:fatty acyl-AMP ligase [Streptomyces sp. CA-249302]|uniref:fatty acyl-AMP ligase n=1 Tax=Streptomyces sp. CA-249302 TaxID=3240058 RepID=UPI003D9392D3